MKVRVCTGFSPSGYHEYGAKFLETFHAYWPKHYELRVYTEEFVKVPRGACIPVEATGVGMFLRKYEKDAKARGRSPTDKWKDSERASGYSYKWDAWKFSRQVCIPHEAAKDLAHGDILVWLDADVITISPAPSRIAEDLIADKDLCFLGRGRKHTELGFWACRINDATLAMLQAMSECITREKVFDLAEWHSAYIFDRMREKWVNPDRQRDLSPGGHGHVWFTTPLGSFSDHLKGNRKAKGFSPERHRR